jgi:uncharacterized membrane protein
VQAALAPALIGQVGYRGDWPGFWIFLAIMTGTIVVLLVLFFMSQPPSGPKIGE